MDRHPYIVVSLAAAAGFGLEAMAFALNSPALFATALALTAAPLAAAIWMGLRLR